MTPGALGADSRGDFSIRGAGILSCEAYNKARSEQSGAYLMIGGWLDGYITGMNKYAPGTYDATSFESTELFATIIGKHCRENPQDRLFSVVNTIMVNLNDDRIRERSPFTRVKVGDKQTKLYQETLRRVQRELIRRGFYNGDVTGLWDEQTQRGLETFQTESDLKASGFPDQTTLWRLLRREIDSN